MCLHAGSESECWQLREEVGRLEARLSEEREAHLQASTQQQGEVEVGRRHVAQLEAALQQCKVEVEGHMSRLEKDSTQYSTQIWQVKAQVSTCMVHVTFSYMHVTFMWYVASL